MQGRIWFVGCDLIPLGRGFKEGIYWSLYSHFLLGEQEMFLPFFPPFLPTFILLY
jgi:hypothetical protein